MGKASELCEAIWQTECERASEKWEERENPSKEKRGTERKADSEMVKQELAEQRDSSEAFSLRSSGLGHALSQPVCVCVCVCRDRPYT